MTFSLSTAHAVSFLHIIALGLFYLGDEVIEALFSLFTLDLTDMLSILIRHSHLHFCQIALLLVHGAVEHFLFSVHVIVTVEVDCLGTCRCVLQILLHSLIIELLSLLLRETIPVALELLTCTDNACL